MFHMSKIFFSILLFFTLIVLAGCATSVVQLKPMGPKGEHVYKITVLGFSRDIRDDAISNAEGVCRKQNKHFKFIKNIFLPKSVSGVDLISLDLFFICVDEEQAAESIAPEKDTVEGESILPAATVPEEKKQDEPKPEAGEDALQALPIPAPTREKHNETTGDTPGEEESLGDRTGSAGEEPAPRKHGGPIIEEVLDD